MNSNAKVFGFSGGAKLVAMLVLTVSAMALSSCGGIAARSETRGVASSAITIVEGRPRKTFTNWMPGQITIGACQARNGRLILHPDGSYEWQVELLTKDAGRSWQQAFHFYDGDNPEATWFGSRDGGGFNIEYANVWTYWRYARGPGDRKLAEAFERISNVIWSVSC